MNIDRRQVLPLLVILGVSVLLRVAVALYLGDSVPLHTDETSYSALGARLANGYGYSFDRGWYPFTQAGAPTAHWSFLYTAWVAAIYAFVGVHPVAVRLVGAVAGGVLLPLAVYRLASRVRRGDEPFALLAAAGAALYAYFILYAAQLMTETFYIAALLWSLERTLALGSALRSGRDKASVLAVGLTQGLTAGVAALLRQSVLPWIVVALIWLLWSEYRHGRLRRALPALFASCLMLALCILPFTVRNYLVYGDFLLLNSNAGYAMYSAQHPMHGTDFQAFAAAPLPADLERGLNESQLDRELMRRGLEFVLEDIARYLRLSLSRVADYFMFWPSSSSSLINNLGRVISFALYLPFMAYGLYRSLGDWRRYRLLYGFMGFYSLLHILTWSMIRYRLPVDAVLMLFAALGLSDVGERWVAKLRGRVSEGGETTDRLRRPRDRSIEAR